jgi:hypothetical protein
MTQALHAIGPLDGRYRGRLQGVADYFSEYAYIKHRVEVEIEYFIGLLQLDPPLPQLSGLVVNDALLAKLRSVRLRELFYMPPIPSYQLEFVCRSIRILMTKMPSG